MQTQILHLDNTGQPLDWIKWQDAVTYHAKGLVTWSMGEIEFTFHGGKSRMTGETSTIKTASIIAVRGETKRKFRAPALNNPELFRRDRHMCAYCGGLFTEGKLSRDHIKPTSRGGLDTWMNVVTCCGKCNQRKDDRTPEEAGMQLLYVPYVPSRAEHLILKNRHILADQMEFLLAFVPENSRVRQEIAS
jgi:5-methylcytosine-specific restriction endonuclease McrA